MSIEPVLRCEDVTKTFGGLRAVDGVDFELHEGEIRGLVGPNGSGKSTLINLLSGHLPADGGRIWRGSDRIERLPAHRIAELGIARTYQTPRPFETLSVGENVRAACYFGTRDDRPEDADRESLRWLEFVGLAGRAGAAVGSLTLHERKLLELARSLACRPRVLFLDEVLTGLNPRELAAGIDLVRRIRDQGVSIVVVEHIMRVILDLSDHLTVLNFGRVIARGEPHACLNEKQVVEAYLGASRA